MKFRWELVIGLVVLLLVSSCKKDTVTKKEITVLGHAGISLSVERAVYPPNTLKAMQYGMDVLGADGVEIDVQLTKDSVLVLFHDDFLDENTTGKGCVGQYNWEEIKNVTYNSMASIALFADGIEEVMERKKWVMLDVKHYDFCAESYIDFDVFNRALNRVIEERTTAEKKRIIINSRSIDLLHQISDTIVLKAYETSKIDEGIAVVKTEEVDLLTLKLIDLSSSIADDLTKNNITYCIFGVKVKAEIEKAIAFKPAFIISDNIARTKHKLN